MLKIKVTLTYGNVSGWLRHIFIANAATENVYVQSCLLSNNLLIFGVAKRISSTNCARLSIDQTEDSSN